MRLTIDRRDSRMTHYNFDKELEEKIVKTIRELVEEGTIRDWDVVFFDLVENNKENK